MTTDSDTTVTVIGAGTMGHGITEVVAMHGYDVTLQDIDETALKDGYDRIMWSLEKLEEKNIVDDADRVTQRIETETDLGVAVADADIVIEGAPENLDLKQRIFADLDAVAPEDALLATNTSSLSITEIASVIDRPEQVVGMHFFNPPVKMNLVEVIRGSETTTESVNRAIDFVESIEKTPIEVQKDVFGFVVNNILHAFLDEPAWMVSRDEATIKGADAALTHQRGYPMGSFELADLTGLDVIAEVRDAGNIPIAPVTQERVDTGDYGQKTDRGYYDYSEGGGVNYDSVEGLGFDTLHVEACMANQAAKLIEQDVTTPEDIDTGVQLGAGFPTGICRRADDIGLGTILHKLRTLQDKYGDKRYEPAEYLVELVRAGTTGSATESGFYDYE